MPASWLTNKIGSFCFFEGFEYDVRFEMIGVKKSKLFFVLEKSASTQKKKSKSPKK
jgi:hypothetical protein